MISKIHLKPVIKWAGGKSRLLNFLLPELPNTYDNYIEPFIGSGAVCFALQNNKAIISDINCHLINTYQIIRDKLDDLISIFSWMPNTKEYFYEIRQIDLETLSNVEQAARFIYLNKTCFNGLYRENSKGQFNVPYGYYKNPRYYDEQNLLKISKYLNRTNIEIYCQDYKDTLILAGEGDLIYIDSPYYIMNKTSFTKYTKNDFKEEDHIELAKEFKRLDALGCFLMLSNSDTPFIVDLYKEFKQIKLTTNRAINSKGDSRKNTGLELLIKNF